MIVLMDVNTTVIWNLKRWIYDLNLSLPVKAVCFIMQLRKYKRRK